MPSRAVWIASLAGASALLIGGVALASNKPAPAAPSGCQTWTKVTDAAAAESILVALGQMAQPVNLNSVPPGVYYYTLNGKQIRFVNNMDGSLGNQYPDTPAGNTSIYTCTG